MSDQLRAQPVRELSPEHRRYVAGETVVGVVINGGLSLVFAILVSLGRDAIPLSGGGGMAVDFLPQTFMMTFAMTLAVTLVTRKRIRDGKVVPLASAMAGPLARAPRNALLRAVVFGAVVAIVGAPVAAGALYVLGVKSLATVSFIAMKVAYGVIVTLIIAPPIIRAALAPQE